MLCLSTGLIGNPREWLEIHHGEGSGYARTNEEELSFIADVAHSSGVVLDHTCESTVPYAAVPTIASHQPQTSLLASPIANSGLGPCTDSGKALYHFCEHAKASPETYRNKRILFWHTGGLLGLFAAQAQLTPLMPRVERLRL